MSKAALSFKRPRLGAARVRGRNVMAYVHAASGALISFQLDSAAKTPAYRQLYEALRRAIVSGRLAPGSRLPASRVFAQELSLSRNTVVAAYDLLASEGYLHSRVGAGAHVATVLPEELSAPQPPDALPAADQGAPSFSARGQLLSSIFYASGSSRPVPFVADVPAFDVFPLAAWARQMAQSWQQVQPTMLGYADPAGYMPLREEIASHLRATRSLRCEGAEIIMTSGSQQSLDLLARMLLDPGDTVWIEDPGYFGARSALIAAGARLVAVPVDAEGIMVLEGAARAPAPKLIFITPSRQYPLGVTLGMARRAELLAYAESCGAWVIEDDYDCEFRYRGVPLPAVQSMDRSGRVIYLGTFSKSLLPSFRLGFFVAPPALAEAFAKAKGTIDRHPPLLEQVTLDAFMRSGQFAAHIRRMRRIYAERQEVLLTEARAQLAGFLRVEPADSGVHLVGLLPEGVDDLAFCAKAGAAGISLRPLSGYYLAEPPRQGVILGFAAIPPRMIKAGIARLALVAGRSGGVWQGGLPPA